MITEAKKYLILGTEEDLDLFYERAQQEGFIEFISSSRKSKEVPEHIQILLKAVKLLQKLPPVEAFQGERALEDAGALAERVLYIKQEVEKLQEDRRITETEIARISPFGDFDLEEVHFIEREGHSKIQFFCAKSGVVDLPSKENLIHVGSFYDLDYFISISQKTVSYPGMIEMRIDHSLQECLNQKALIEESIHFLEVELKQLAGHLEFFQEALVEQLNIYHLNTAKQDVSYPLNEIPLFAVEAWIPRSKVSRMFSLLSGLSVHCEPIQIEKTDAMPTIMENTGVSRLGEDLVKVYDIPAVTDKDPSGWVFCFFALFAAIIVADGGYGLFYLLTALFLKWKLPAFKGASKRFFRTCVILSSCMIIWGVVTSSFFGLNIKPDSFLGKISPLQSLVTMKADYHLKSKDAAYHEWIEAIPVLAEAKTGKEFVAKGLKHTTLGVQHVVYETYADNILLEFSLMLGILHISISLIRYGRRNWSQFGWVLFLVGGYLFFPCMLHVTSMANFLGWIDPNIAAPLGKQMMYVGICSAIGLALIQRKWMGILELTKLVEIFADILSYLRLYALALAGTILAETFNSMGESVGLVIGFFIVILGHGVNMTLGLMAIVIHGLRLNFIEWYHYSFTGGGRQFNPLMLLKSKED